MITGIIIALPDEISSLSSQKVLKGECIFINQKTIVACSGAGPVNAAKASELVIKKGANRLISWGCAAALSPDLKPGDLVLPKKILTENQQLLSIDSGWLQNTTQQLAGLSPNSGLLAGSSVIVAESKAKSSIHQKSKAVALDMESSAIVQIAKQHKMPSLVIRCIADPVEMSLPKAVSYALNKQGEVILSKLLWFLLLHPSELPGLINLGLHFNAAKNKLKLVAKQLDIISGFETTIASK